MKKRRLIDLVNTMFPLYIRYCESRGYSLTCVEWNRNIKPILDSGYLRAGTIQFCELELERIKRELEECGKDVL